MRKVIIIAILLIVGPGIAISNAQEKVSIDDTGIMRWSSSGKEIQGFGVNYTVPFAHAYRSSKKLGVDPKGAIDQDIYHFARLGFDAYRVHVWDTQISDTLGNLLENEHLDLFDYMVSEMQKRGMNMLLTPIAFWGNGWPERDTWTPGFAHKYGKDGCLINEEAIKAQANYLVQFLNHVNPYTGQAYKDDPKVVAFEVSNEPHHYAQDPDSVTRYVKKMVESMKSTGSTKPILYNISHGVHLVDAYFKGGIDGGTFQWYPTGLGAGEELKGNFLPNVDRYDIPFSNNESFQEGVKVVYEFDAADVGRSYIYPAMARSFRTAGIQWATHFAYDPTYLAYANTEYNTHYMNLVYTPQKALALKIAGEVFHQVPVYKDFGSYPTNAEFGNFKVSYEEDLAVLNSSEKFIHTNHTREIPKDIEKLKHIAGWGNSPIVKYDGTGAYFLDEIQTGVWRLEVLPDAVWIKDPFGKNSLNRRLTEIVWETRKIDLSLPSLGSNYSVQPIDDGNSWKDKVDESGFSVRPGTYLLVKKGTKLKGSIDQKWANIRLNEFAGIEPTIDKSYVLHEPPEFVTANQSLTVSAEVVESSLPNKVSLLTYDGWRPVEIDMVKKHGFTYETTVPSRLIKKSFLRYFIQVDELIFPEAIAAVPSDWDFDADPYTVSVVGEDSPVYLYNAFTDNEEVSRVWRPGSYLAPLSNPGKGELVLKVDELVTIDSENPAANPVYDYSLRYHFAKRLEGRKIDELKQLTLVGRNLKEGSVPVQVALIMKDGSAYGSVVDLGTKDDYCILLKDLKPVRMVTLPRPYPTFLPYHFEGSGITAFDINNVETLQISIGPGMTDQQKDQAFEVAIESMRLE